MSWLFFLFIFFYQTVKTALRIARFLLVSCQITSFFFFLPQKKNAVPLNQRKNTIAVEFVASVFCATKLKAF